MTAFGPSHPFWNNAVTLRRAGKTLTEIAEVVAKEFPEITYAKVRYGMRKANIAETLPLTDRFFLRGRYKEVEEGFDTIRSMRELVIQALATAQEIEEELASADNLTTGARMHLESQLSLWLSRAMEWAEKTANAEIKMKNGETRGRPINIENYQHLTVNDVQKAIEATKEEYAALLPPASSMIDIKTTFGSENVRLPGEKIEDGDYLEFDDEDGL